jgi:predicted ferric reductase
METQNILKRYTNPFPAGLLRVILYAAIVAAPLVLAGIFRTETDHGFLFELGKSLGLLGFGMLGLQFVLAARLKWLNRPFGLDMVLRFHKAMAIAAVVFLLLHPVLLAVGGAGIGLFLDLQLPWYIYAGKLGLVLVLVQGITSMYRMSLGMKFEKWRLLHNQAPVIFVLVFLHSWNAGGDLALASVQALWWVLLAAAAAAYLFHKVWNPQQLKKNTYRVEEVRQETHNVWTLTFSPPEGAERYAYLPGQFHFIRLFRGGDLSTEEHHFTISSSPTQDGFVSSTIKESGDFTAAIGKTKEGDKAAIQAPFGRFSYLLHPEEKDIVFIAGGIGITPLMSMLRHMRDTEAQLNVVLIYANETEADIVFKSEIDEIQTGDNPSLKVVYVLNDPPADWQGETGYVDKEKLMRFCGNDLAAKAFYICGPPPMSDGLTQILQDSGVSARHIHKERFSL